MKKIAITGNIASGKSQVENILENLNYTVYDTDKIAHDCLSKIKDFYGFDVFTNGIIDRQKLGTLVFSNPQIKKKLEDLIHPIIKKEVLNIFEKNKNKDFVFISVPLLFETDFYKLFDKIILVTADDKLRLERLMKRNQLTKEDAMLRINAQMSQEEKISKSDFVIENNSTLDKLKDDLYRILKII